MADERCPPPLLLQPRRPNRYPHPKMWSFRRHQPIVSLSRLLPLQELLKLATLLYSASRVEQDDTGGGGGGGGGGAVSSTFADDEAEAPLTSQARTGFATSERSTGNKNVGLIRPGFSLLLEQTGRT